MDAPRKLPKAVWTHKSARESQNLRFGSPETPTRFASTCKKRAKTSGFCNVLQTSNKSELKRTQQNQRSVARPRKREKRAKARGFEHVFTKRACKNEEKTDAEPRPRGPKNAVKRMVFATFSKKRTRKLANSKRSEKREKRDKTHGFRRLFGREKPRGGRKKSRKTQ